MSAFVVSDKHINCMVEFTRLALWTNVKLYVFHDGKPHQYNLNDPVEAAQVGKILFDENVRSVKCRYSSDDESYTYKYERTARKLTPVEMLKAIDCYNYQACETDDYYTSFAHAVARAMQVKAISQLDGYDQAPWGID